MSFNLNANPQMPTSMGRIIRAEYILAVETPVDGCCICSDRPRSAIPIIVHLSPAPPKQFVPPPNFAPKVMPQNQVPVPMNPTPPPFQYQAGQMYNPYQAQPQVIYQPVIVQQVPVMMVPVQQPMMMVPAQPQPMMAQGQQQQPMMVQQQQGINNNQIKPM